MTANAKNLSSLANALDDGTSGQFLQSTGSGGVVFANVAAGATVYDSAELLPLAGNSAGDMAYVTGTNRFYINNGSGWYSISLVNTNPNITSVQDASGYTTPFTLATDGSATVITVTANDPEQIPLTFGYSVTAGSLTNGGGTTATVTQADNVFTVTPTTTEAYAGDFTLTFTASDGVNTATSANLFSLAFRILNSKYTALLATATGTSGNKDITDASSSNHTITVTGDAHAGTFSPYRHGGYSAYFDGSGDYITTTSTDYDLGTSSAFTVELWYYFDESRTHTVFDFYNSSNAQTGKLAVTSTNVYLYDGVSNILALTRTQTVGAWEHFCWTRDASNNHTFYINGSQVGTSTAATSIDAYTIDLGRRAGNFNSTFMKGYISDFRIVKGTAITPASGGPTERLTAITNTQLLTCHLPYIADGSSSAHTITVNGNTSTKPFGPYDYKEYSESIYGGSVYFDGSDYLQLSATATDLLPETSNTTIEAWVNTTGTGHVSVFSNFNPSSPFNGMEVGLYNGYQTFYSQGSWINNTGGTGVSTINDGSWHHLAWVITNSGATVTTYVDGVQNYTSSITASTTGSSNQRIGASSNSTVNRHFTGYISDVRFVKGTAVYSGAFTPPTAPLSSTGSALHIKGTAASIIDKSQVSNLKLVGNTTGSTAQVKFANTKSMYFDGSGDSVFVPYESIPSFGIIEFTIEGWIYMNNLTGNQLIVDKWVSGNSQGFQFYHRSTGSSLTFYVGSTVVVQDPSSSSISAQAWHHVAITRDSSANVRLYVDGLKKAQSTSNVSFDNTADLYLGVQGSTSTNYFNGYMQDVKLSNKALYTADDESSNIPSAPLKG